MTQQVARDIFRAYDIRGVFDDTLTTDVAYFIGRAYASEVASLTSKKSDLCICVGYDGRLSSPKLRDALIQGLQSSNANVIDVGLGPTPQLYFATKNLKADAGIMITGSHNPPTHNGFKMLLQNRPFFGDDIASLLTRIESNDFIDGQGSFQSHDMKLIYVKELLKVLKSKTSLKVAFDPGNGAAGDVLKELLPQISKDMILINGDIDGNFPNHHPDPTVPKNLEQLKEIVLSQRCDFGVAFDGDADRIGVIDDCGNILWGDQLMMIYSKDVLSRNKGATIIADVKTSQVLFDFIASEGGNPIMAKTGHSLIKSKMAEHNALLAGEMSGHIFFKENYYGFDDALFAAMRLIDILSKQSEKLSAIVQKMPKVFNTPEMRFACDGAKKFQIVDDIKKILDAQNIAYNDVDGVRVKSNDGWWLIRASNTESILVGRCEAQSQESLDDMFSQLKTLLQNVGIDPISLTH